MLSRDVKKGMKQVAGTQCNKLTSNTTHLHIQSHTILWNFLDRACVRIVLPEEGLWTETLQKKSELLSQVKIVEQITSVRKFCNIMQHSTILSLREWLFSD